MAEKAENSTDTNCVSGYLAKAVLLPKLIAKLEAAGGIPLSILNKLEDIATSVLKAGDKVDDIIPNPEKVEVLAQRALTEMQGQIQGAHFLTRHSPMMTLPELLQRATVGIPNAAGTLVKNNATRFFNYADMKTAVEKAIKAYEVGGLKGRQNIVIDMLKPIGEGYYKGTGAYGVAQKVVVGFNQFGQVVTAFPLLP